VGLADVDGCTRSSGAANVLRILVGNLKNTFRTWYIRNNMAYIASGHNTPQLTGKRTYGVGVSTEGVHFGNRAFKGRRMHLPRKFKRNRNCFRDKPTCSNEHYNAAQVAITK